MKALFKLHPQNSFRYHKHPKGYEFVTTVIDDSESWSYVAEREDQDWFPQDDGKVLTSSGSEAFDPKDPTRFHFGDYEYRTIELSSIDYDSAMVDAIEKADPWNITDILWEVNEKYHNQ